MIFDHMNDHMDESMMSWSSYMWFYIILGLFIFFIIAIILIYLVNRGSRKDKEITKLSQESIQDGVAEEMQSKNLYFCPNCGETLEDKALRYCPLCGSEI
ncbi:MAG: zinc ribbon domain-containing protein [Candidatus Hodarchaeota archaeon]